jgi:hypothetical protein
VQYILCVVLPSGLPGGSIVLEGFVGNLFRSEPGSAQEFNLDFSSVKYKKSLVFAELMLEFPVEKEEGETID